MYDTENLFDEIIIDELDFVEFEADRYIKEAVSRTSAPQDLSDMLITEVSELSKFMAHFSN